MKAKWLKIMLIIMSVTLLVGLVACSDRGNDDFTPDNVGEPDEKDTVYTVAVFNDTLYNVNYYLAGQTVILTSKQVPGKQFVRWEIDGEALSYQEQTTYTVERNAVIKAIYVATGMVEVEDVLDAKFTVEFDSDESIESGVLYNGYHFSVTIPTKQYYTFTGYYNENGTKITDSKGKSIIAYDGSFNKLVPQFSENDFVNIVIKNGETNEIVKEQKWYVEDGEYEALASNVVDRQCIGWVNEKGEEVSTSSTLSVAMKGLTAGATYEFTAKYREAYKLMVISGYGSGAYAKEDKVNLSCTAPVGKEFLYWEITDGDKVYTLGVKNDGEKEYLGLIDGENFLYYDGEQKVTQDNLDDVTKLGKKYDFLMGDLEKMGVEIVGKQTVISAVFNKVIFYLTYKLDHMVDGVSALDEETVDTLKNLGFVDNNGVFEKVVEYEYNDTISLINIPEVDNYSFERWQSATGAAIPTTMPQEDVELVGTFKANKYNVTVVSPANGTVKIGSGGNTTSGYYSYNSTIKIFVTADVGYEFDKWRNIEDMVITLTEVERNEGEIISYVFEYVVKEKQRFTVDFTTRMYKIAYMISFEHNGLKENTQYAYEREYAYGDKDTEDDLAFAYPTPDALGLIHPTYWIIGSWKITTDEEGTDNANVNPNRFVMPAQDLYATCVYTIRSYEVTLLKEEGVDICSVRTINGKESAEYLTDSENLTYTVPYGSSFVADVEYGVGYDKGRVESGEIIIDSENASLVIDKEAEDGRYQYKIEFEMLIARAAGVTYTLRAVKNVHTLSHYVYVDYEHGNKEIDIYNYLQVDRDDYKVFGEKTYYRLKSTSDAEESELTQEEYHYNEVIKAYNFNSSTLAASKYTSTNWKKYYHDNGQGEPIEYLGTTMPDDSVYMCADVNLNSYSLSIGTNKFAFDGNPDGYVDTAIENRFEHVGESEAEFVNGNAYRYYSHIVVQPESPTGYDFVAWQVTRGNTNTTLEPEGEGLQKQNGYHYESHADGSLTLYLTDNLTISATFKKKILKLTIEGSEVVVQNPNSSGSYFNEGTVELEYGTPLTVRLNTNGIRAGDKVTRINVVDSNGDEIEAPGEDGENRALSVTSEDNLQIDSENYKYAQSTFKLIDYLRQDTIITPDVERIKYKITYVVYSALDEVKDWTKDTESIGTMYDEIELNQNKTLILEDALFEKFGETISTKLGGNKGELMYSGWFDEISASASEGEGFAQDGKYTSAKTYTHTTKNANATFYCYLINVYDFITNATGVEISINKLIRDVTPGGKGVLAYKTYFSETRKVVELPAVSGESPVVAVGNFAGMTGIEELTIPTGVTTINANAFLGCSGLNVVTYNENLKLIDAKAFQGCTSLEGISIPNAVESIGESAFEGCTGLQNVNYQSGTKLKSIGIRAFYGCTSLTKVNLESETIEDNVIKVPDSVYNLYESAFEGCKEIESVILGEKVFGIETKAFANLPKLNKVILNTSSIDKSSGIKVGIFSGSGSETEGGFTVEVGENTSYVHSNFFRSEVDENHGKHLGEVSISGSGNVEIGEYAFRNSGLRRVAFNDRVVNVGQYAFAGCKGLESANLGETKITAIANWLFSNSGIKEVIMPAGVVNVGSYAFAGCDKMESLYYTAKADGTYAITEIKNNAFNKEDGGASNTIVRFVDVSLREEVLLDANTHKRIDIPDGITTLGKYAFGECANVKEVVIPSTLTNVGEGVFYLNTELKNVFYNAYAVAGVSISGDSGKTPFEGAGASGFTITIGEDVAEVGANLFTQIDNLAAVDYKASGNVSLVDSGIFNGSGNAVNGIEFNVYANVTVLPAYLFYGANKVKTINIIEDSERILTIDMNAFVGVVLEELTLTEMAQLTLVGGAFNDADVKKVTFSNQIKVITIESGALSSNDKYGDVVIAYAGAELSGDKAYLHEGTLVSTKNANGGYDTEVLNGNIIVDGVLRINENDTLNLTATIMSAYKDVRVIGELTMDENSEVRKMGAELIAIPRDEANLSKKALDNIAYDVFEIDGEFDVVGNIDVEMGALRIPDGAAINIGAASVAAISVTDVEIVGGIVVEGTLDFVCAGDKQGVGAIKASSGSQTIVKINDKTYVDNANKTALSISEGELKAYLTDNNFVIESDAVVTVDSEFSWDDSEILTLKGTLTNNASAEVAKFVMEETANLIVGEKFAIGSSTDGIYPQIANEKKIDAGVNRQPNLELAVYYKDLKQAFDYTEAGETNVVLNVREDINAGEDTIKVECDAIVYLNGKTYTYSGTGAAISINNIDGAWLSLNCEDIDGGTVVGGVATGGNISAPNGMAFEVVSGVIMGFRLTIEANVAAVVKANNGELRLANNEISANKGISVQNLGEEQGDTAANVQLTGTTITADVGVEIMPGVGSVTIDKSSTITATDYALYLMSEESESLEFKTNEITVDNSTLSSSSNKATSTDAKATIFVGHVASMSINGTISNASGTAVLADNRFVVENGAGDEYKTYINEINSSFSVDVSAATITGEVAEIVRGQYASQYVGRIKVKDGDAVGLQLTQWDDETLNYARYVKNSEADSTMVASGDTSPYVALVGDMEINVDLTSNNVIIANKVYNLTINSQSIEGSIHVENLTEIIVNENATIAANFVAENVESLFTVGYGKVVTIASSNVPIKSIANKGVLLIRASLGAESAAILVDKTGEMQVDDGSMVYFGNEVSIGSQESLKVISGTVQAENITNDGTIEISGNLVVTNKLNNKSAMVVKAASSIESLENTGEIEVTGSGAALTLTMSSDVYTLAGRIMVGENATLKASEQNKVNFTSGAVITVDGTIANLEIYLQENVVVVDTNDALTLYDSASIDGEAIELTVDGGGYVLVEIQQNGNPTGKYAKYTHACNVVEVTATCGESGYKECTTEKLDVEIDSTRSVVYEHGKFDETPATGEHNYADTLTIDETSTEYKLLQYGECSGCTAGDNALVVFAGTDTEADATNALSGYTCKGSNAYITYTVSAVGDNGNVALSDSAVGEVTIDEVTYSIVEVTLKRSYGTSPEAYILVQQE